MNSISLLLIAVIAFVAVSSVHAANVTMTTCPTESYCSTRNMTAVLQKDTKCYLCQSQGPLFTQPATCPVLNCTFAQYQIKGSNNCGKCVPLTGCEPCTNGILGIKLGSDGCFTCQPFTSQCIEQVCAPGNLKVIDSDGCAICVSFLRNHANTLNRSAITIAFVALASALLQ